MDPATEQVLVQARSVEQISVAKKMGFHGIYQHTPMVVVYKWYGGWIFLYIYNWYGGFTNGISVSIYMLEILYMVVVCAYK